MADVTNAVATPKKGGALITWTDPTDTKVASFTVQYGITGANDTETVSVAKGTQSCTAYYLTGGSEYTFTIYSVSSDGTKSVGTAVTVTPENAVTTEYTFSYGSGEDSENNAAVSTKFEDIAVSNTSNVVLHKGKYLYIGEKQSVSFYVKGACKIEASTYYAGTFTITDGISTSDEFALSADGVSSFETDSLGQITITTSATSYFNKIVVIYKEDVSRITLSEPVVYEFKSNNSPSFSTESSNETYYASTDSVALTQIKPHASGGQCGKNSKVVFTVSKDSIITAVYDYYARGTISDGSKSVSFSTDSGSTTTFESTSLGVGNVSSEKTITISFAESENTTYLAQVRVITAEEASE